MINLKIKNANNQFSYTKRLPAVTANSLLQKKSINMFLLAMQRNPLCSTPRTNRVLIQKNIFLYL